MGNVGRFFCVALPFALCIGSLVFLLIPTLFGVTNKDAYLFRVDTRELEINPASLAGIVSTRSVDFQSWHDHSKLAAEDRKEAAAAGGSKSSNITAADLQLDYIYDISIWGVCATDNSGKKECSQPKFDWASSLLNTSWIQDFGAVAGRKIELPKEITTSLDAFKTVSRWTQIVFVVAFVALALEIVLGIFANCTRVMSCITWIVAGVASTAVCGAAALATVMAAVVVGAVESTAKFYGVRGSINTSFLALVWISAALALGAGFFWLFTICCCAPDHRRRDRHRASADGEKLLPNNNAAYQPLHEPGHTGFYSNQQQQYGAPRYPSGARSDLAYEPYSHRA